MTPWRHGGTRVLGGVAVLALIGSLWPAWQLWLHHEAQWEWLSRQRLSLMQAQEEARALQHKSIPTPSEAVRQIQAISRQRFNTLPVSLSPATLQLQLKGLSAEQLALGWNEIRSSTSASVIQADLSANAQGWSGTLVLQLAQKP